MARSKDSYIIEVHYPENKEAMLDLKKKIGAVYIQFVKDYILTMPISDEEKNKLYSEVVERLLKRNVI
jgi:hypothetical protein